MFKELIISLFIVSLCHLAHGETVQVVETSASVGVSSLRCVIFPQRAFMGGANPQIMVIGEYTSGGGRPLQILREEPGSIQLEHRGVTSRGCDTDAINHIYDQAISSFSFVNNVPIVITRTTTPPFIHLNGKCYVRMTEKLEMDLGGGIKLESTESEAYPSNKCSS